MGKLFVGCLGVAQLGQQPGGDLAQLRISQIVEGLRLIHHENSLCHGKAPMVRAHFPIAPRRDNPKCKAVLPSYQRDDTALSHALLGKRVRVIVGRRAVAR